MNKPLPPVVQGPITPFSPAVRVVGALQGAQVTVLQGGVALGRATAAVNGDLDVNLSRKPVVGQSVVSVQEIGGLTSEPSVYGMLVIDVPQPLPMPNIASTLHTCMVDVLGENLVPGATVHAHIGGQPFGTIVAQQTRQWLSLDPLALINPGSQLMVWQELNVGGGQVLKSATFASLPIPNWIRDEHGLRAPKLGTPLQSCATTIPFLDVAGGASTSIDNEGMNETYVNPNSAFLGHRQCSTAQRQADRPTVDAALRRGKPQGNVRC